jgi:hypothetical protein
MSGPTPCPNIVRSSVLARFMHLTTYVVRWDPKREDTTFFHQSAVIWSAYYQLQILCHRPFIPQGEKRTTMSFASLAIVLNAARASVRIIDIHGRRKGGFVPSQIVSNRTITISQIITGYYSPPASWSRWFYCSTYGRDVAKDLRWIRSRRWTTSIDACAF